MPDLKVTKIKYPPTGKLTKMKHKLSFLIFYLSNFYVNDVARCDIALLYNPKGN